MARRGENIYLRKDGRWEGRYIKGKKPDGKARFGYVYGSRYAEVKRKLIQKKAETGQDAEHAVLHYRDGTFGEWLEYWMEEMTRPYIGETTCQTYKSQAETHLLPAFGTRQIASIRQDDVQQFVNAISRKLAPGTVHNVFRLLRSILNAARKKGLVHQNPCDWVKRPRYRVKTPRVLSRAEQERLEKTAAEREETEYLLCLYTGLRLGELCALRWQDIDFENNMLYVTHTVKRVRDAAQKRTRIILDRPKTDCSEREVPVPAFLMRSLKARKKRENAQNDEFVFKGRGAAHADPRTMQLRFHKTAGELGIAGAHFHTLRHTFATRCLEQHVGIETLAELLGHSSPQITLKCYAHCTRENKVASIGKLRCPAG